MAPKGLSRLITPARAKQTAKHAANAAYNASRMGPAAPIDPGVQGIINQFPGQQAQPLDTAEPAPQQAPNGVLGPMGFPVMSPAPTNPIGTAQVSQLPQQVGQQFGAAQSAPQHQGQYRQSPGVYGSRPPPQNGANDWANRLRQPRPMGAQIASSLQPQNNVWRKG